MALALPQSRHTPIASVPTSTSVPTFLAQSEELKSTICSDIWLLACAKVCQPMSMQQRLQLSQIEKIQSLFFARVGFLKLGLPRSWPASRPVREAGFPAQGPLIAPGLGLSFDFESNDTAVVRLAHGGAPRCRRRHGNRHGDRHGDARVNGITATRVGAVSRGKFFRMVSAT